MDGFTRNTIKSHVFCTILIGMVLFSLSAWAERGTNSAFRSTAYPLPRFVSLSADKAYVRAGPGERFPIQWEYRKKGLPMEIILEFDHWRKVRDFEGEEGWMHKTLLSGRRTGMVISDGQVPLWRKPESDSRLVAYLGPSVVVGLEECTTDWCHVAVSGFKGWMPKKYIWGVYEAETFD